MFSGPSLTAEDNTLFERLKAVSGQFRRQQPGLQTMIGRTQTALATLRAWGGPAAAEMCGRLEAKFQQAEAFANLLNADADLLERLTVDIQNRSHGTPGSDALRIGAAFSLALANELDRQKDEPEPEMPLIVDFAPFELTRGPAEVARVARSLAAVGQPLADLAYSVRVNAREQLAHWEELLLPTALLAHSSRLMSTCQLGDSLSYLGHGLKTMANENRRHHSLTFEIRPYPDLEVPSNLYFELVLQQPIHLGYRIVPPAMVAAAASDGFVPDHGAWARKR